MVGRCLGMGGGEPLGTRVRDSSFRAPAPALASIGRPGDYCGRHSHEYADPSVEVRHAIPLPRAVTDVRLLPTIRPERFRGPIRSHEDDPTCRSSIAAGHAQRASGSGLRVPSPARLSRPRTAGRRCRPAHGPRQPSPLEPDSGRVRRPSTTAESGLVPRPEMTAAGHSEVASFGHARTEMVQRCVCRQSASHELGRCI